MPLKLMYITNRPAVSLIAEKSGVDRIFVDMEYIGKELRQGGLDTVKNRHTVSDVRSIRSVLTKAELLVRVNPIHNASGDYGSSEEEIEDVLNAGADLVMLPYYKTVSEVKRFLSAVNGRARTVLLLETAEAAECLTETLKLSGIDEFFIGLNDLSLSYHKTFLFELLCDGILEELCCRLRTDGRFFGFGGIAALGTGDVPAEYIVREHYRLGSRAVILSRAFCDETKLTDDEEAGRFFAEEIGKIRALEEECAHYATYFTDNEKVLRAAIRKVARARKAAAS